MKKYLKELKRERVERLVVLIQFITNYKSQIVVEKEGIVWGGSGRFWEDRIELLRRGVYSGREG